MKAQVRNVRSRPRVNWRTLCLGRLHPAQGALKRTADSGRILPMSNLRVASTELMSQGEDTLARMSQPEFIAAWKAMVGEPPAMMLSSRSEMIRLLVDSTSIEPPVGSLTCLICTCRLPQEVLN